ncbi:MAG TPA: 3-phosphoglycerate dehydrogenase, partial [Actinobacteria bacterium]|nr:3-phosphoglycerate dehydrogenase [Actinomycetota bacterium]
DGHLRGAAIDVYEHEPVDHVMGERFKDVPNLILTPHIAGITEESNVRVSAMTANFVRDALQEEAP